jgi:hypothetical protein
MPTVSGFGAFTGFQIAEESAWGTPIATWLDMPIIRETLKTTHTFAPPSPEFNDTGAETNVEHVTTAVAGEIQFNARLDAKWFHWILGHILGTEDLYVDFHINGVAGTGANSHWYLPSNQGRSLAFRSWKSGPDNSGDWSEFRGCIVSTARIEWVADGLLTWTVAVQGKEEVTAAVSGSLGVPAGAITTSPRWASAAGGDSGNAAFSSGATPGDLNFRAFTININRNVTQVPSFANDIDTANQPAPTAKRAVTVDIASLLEQDFAAANKPYKEYLDRVTNSAVRIKLRDAAVSAHSGRYSIDFDFPSVIWTDADTSLKEAGTVPTSFQFTAKEGTPAAPATGAADYRIGVEVDDADDVDDHFSTDTGDVTQLTAGVP